MRQPTVLTFWKKALALPKAATKDDKAKTGDTQSSPKGDEDKPVAKSDAGESKKNDHPESQA